MQRQYSYYCNKNVIVTHYYTIVWLGSVSTLGVPY